MLSKNGTLFVNLNKIIIGYSYIFFYFQSKFQSIQKVLIQKISGSDVFIPNLFAVKKMVIKKQNSMYEGSLLFCIEVCYFMILKANTILQ